MKKLKYEKPEVEIELLDPELDIITASQGTVGGTVPGTRSGEELFKEDNFFIE